MDVPAETVEIIIRFAYAVVITIVFGVTASTAYYLRGQSVWWLVLFLLGFLGLSAIWRWYILWLGIRPDVEYNEPLVRTIGSSLALMFTVSVGLIMAHRAMSARRGRRP